MTKPDPHPDPHQNKRCSYQIPVLLFHVLLAPSGPRKEILQEYFDISSLLQHEVVKVHREMSSALTTIDPLTEYESFINQNR